MPIIIKLRRDTADNWFRVNPKLALGEPGIETDTRKFKIGTGVDFWNDLPYMSAVGMTLEEIEDQTAANFFVGGSGISLNYNDVANTLTINTSGLQPSGSYALSSHNHTSSQITNFNSSVSGLLPTISNSGDNRVLTSTGSSVGINAESNLTFDGTNLSSPYLISSNAVGDEGGEIQLAKPPSATLSGGITIDSYQNKLRFFEQGGSARGFYLDISSGGANASTNLSNLTGSYQPSDATLSGIAVLNPVSGNYIYATGTNVFTTGNISLLGRDLIANSTTSGVRTALGLGSIAIYNSADYSISSHTHTLNIGNGTSGVISYLTNERLDIVGSGATSIVYNDSTNKITISSSNSGISNKLGNTSAITINGTYSVGVNLDNTSRSLSQNNTMAIMGGNVGVGTLTPIYDLDIVGAIRSTESVGVVVKPTISSSQNDWNPGDGSVIRVSASNNSLNITGLVAGVDGQRKLLYNGGTRDITLINSSSSSSTNNRFLIFNGSNYILNPNAAVELLYDSTSARWRIFGFVDAPTSTGGGGGGN
jgi:hypothetical protein